MSYANELRKTVRSQRILIFVLMVLNLLQIALWVFVFNV
jgi:hypothetical protein